MIRVALVAGHDKFHKHGAVALGINENEYWNDFIKDLDFLLENSNNVETKIFHRPDQRIHGYKGSMRILHSEIDAWGANLDIEFHFNASKSPAKGHEVLHLHGSFNGKKYATLLDHYFDKHLSNRDRNLKAIVRGDRGWYGLKVGRSASILSEAFFGKEIEEFIGEKRKKMMNAYMDFLINI